jgi:two-component system sensor histidine kinase/response regulator
MANVNSGHPAHEPPSDKCASPVWDKEAALNRMEGDSVLLQEIVQLFLEECPKSKDEIRQALQANDAPLLERLAHTLKGSSANIGATGVCQAALALELQARSGDLAKAREQVEVLEATLVHLRAELEAWSRQVPHEV